MRNPSSLKTRPAKDRTFDTVKGFLPVLLTTSGEIMESQISMYVDFQINLFESA